MTKKGGTPSGGADGVLFSVCGSRTPQVIAVGVRAEFVQRSSDKRSPRQ